ncbi:alpha/beta hydrolase [Flavobacteriaceae bacterium]|nr:alpha/beta hydrolase [Flavobacteriaceae bacterium]
MISKSVTFLSTADKEKIALWKISNSEKNVIDNIFLTHGTFSNKNICLGIANYFAIQGYCCYIMEWRNHGESFHSKKKFNFETIALYDLKTVFTYLFEKLKLNSIHCITHSGGGISLSMFLIKHNVYNEKINSITMFACQVFGASNTVYNKFKIILSKFATFLIGYIPARKIKLGPQNESYFTMKQWFDWNIKRNFYSTDKKFDYKINMPIIKIPIYSISAEGDSFIAPSIGCKIFLESFNNPCNIFKEFSIENRNLENYNHSRIIMSRNSAKEIWPTVLKWIEKTKDNNLYS